jgi:hypothetical protein
MGRGERELPLEELESGGPLLLLLPDVTSFTAAKSAFKSWVTAANCCRICCPISPARSFRTWAVSAPDGMRSVLITSSPCPVATPRPATTL